MAVELRETLKSWLESQKLLEEVSQEDIDELADELEGLLDSEIFVEDAIDEWSLDCDLSLNESQVEDFAEFVFAKHGGE